MKLISSGFLLCFTENTQSPETLSREALEWQRIALWSVSMANNSPPSSLNNTSPSNEPQRYLYLFNILILF